MGAKLASSKLLLCWWFQLMFIFRMLGSKVFLLRNQSCQGTRAVLCCAVQTRSLAFKPQVAENHSFFSPIPPEDIALQFKHGLAGRKHLPGSQGKGFPEFLAPARQGFPYALRTDSDSDVSVVKWGQLCREQLDKALPDYNAVLFRNLPLFGAKDFAKWASNLGYKPTTYEGGTGNRYLADGETEVYLSTSDPPDFNIELHNEMACSPVHPKKVQAQISRYTFSMLTSPVFSHFTKRIWFRNKHFFPKGLFPGTFIKILLHV